MRLPFIKHLLCLYFMAIAYPSTAQLHLYVSTSGNDKNTGSLTSPLKTIQQAVSYAKQKKGEHIVIEIRGGTYYLDQTITIEATSFLPASLDIRSYNKEKVIISAGKRLSLKWKPWKNGIYLSEVPKDIHFERLYINQKLQPLARYPNYDSTARIFNGTAADAFAAERIKKWEHPVGGYVHAIHAYEWGGFHYLIKGVDTFGTLQLEGGWQNNRPNSMHKKYLFVENIKEELDAPGEWWLDKEKSLLYYYPRKEVDINKMLVEVAQHKNTFELKGSETNPLKNIKLSNIHFSHNERSFMDTREPLLRSDWTIYRGGAILLDGTENCSIQDCTFEGIGGNAIFFSNYNRYGTVKGCHIYNIGANAVCFIGDTKAVRSGVHGYENYIPYNQLDKIPGPLSNNYPQECVVDDNLLHNVGIIEKQATGVQIQVASNITVKHNSIYNTSRAGINIGDGSFGGHILEHNDVFNTVQETGDHGSFNSWGRDRFWAANRNYMDSLVAAHPELILLDATKQTIIRNNRFRCDHGWDIDLDDGSSNYHIYNNLCLNGGIKLREGFHRIVENNIMVNNTFHPHVWFTTSGDIFKRNIVMKKYAPIQIANWGDSIDYNFFPDSTALLEAQANGTDKNSLYGIVKFANPAIGDYTVLPGSEVFKTGFSNFAMDKFGVQKPALKKLALQPSFPILLSDAGLSDKSTSFSFLDGFIKSVDGQGDRSAYGLPEDKGVIIMSTGEKNSLLEKSGLLPRDVILSVEGKPLADVKQLLDIYQFVNWKGHILISIIRNQQPLQLTLYTR